MDRTDWLLTPAERDNPATVLDRRHGPDGPAWTEGNDVRPLVHGSTYFARLHEVVQQLGEGDLLFFTDWRGDPDERLTGEDGSEVGQGVLRGRAARRRRQGAAVALPPRRPGVQRRREPPPRQRRQRGRRRGPAGPAGAARSAATTRSSSWPAAATSDVAFAGGIDLCHSRRDDADHGGDPQGLRMSDEYGDTPPWHDVQLEVRGPAVGDLEAVFRERWDDPSPLDNRLRMAVERRLVKGIDTDASELPEQGPDPAPTGTCTLQVLRTYPARTGRSRYPFAPRGERSVAAAYRKVLHRARRFVYLEDQYLWSAEVADLFAEALTREPELHLVAVVPRFPDQGGRLGRPPSLVGRQDALDVVLRAGGDRVSVFDLENHAGTPVYVHAKVCVVDDVWASVGSDNLNLRSWTHDSELSCAVLDDERDLREPRDPAGLGDGARRFARELRLQLWQEHLDVEDGDADGVDDLVDPASGLARLRATAAALDAWHDGGRQGPRPPGRLRNHQADRLPAYTRAWARPLYHLVIDPDGRPRAGLRRTWQ